MAGVKTVGVVGCGLMGSGIVQVSAQAGLKTTVREADQALLDKGLGRIKKFLDDGVTKGKVTAEDRDKTLANIKGTTKLEDLAGCDLVIEAVTENIAVKKEVFSTLDAVCAPDAVLATNTSSLSVTEIAAFAKKPERVLGLHFFNPVPLMKLVEIIRGLQTDDDTYRATKALSERLNKTAITAKDSPGFIVNRILIPLLNEACFALQEGLASPEDIDTGVKLGLNHPMGPLTLADFIGLDTCLAILRVLHSGLGDDKYRPCPLLVQMVDAGWLGRKSGRGFHRYAGPGGERAA
ncbi:MAG TPA: 3-hydroxybutyryl-CoA dehydrogenase [Thermoanaerobaculia bacterium]|nr:3-hydroxybutyryl-CoA dehydrogenase [Thermoanaerobaculia bacterium]